MKTRNLVLFLAISLFTPLLKAMETSPEVDKNKVFWDVVYETFDDTLHQMNIMSFKATEEDGSFTENHRGQVGDSDRKKFLISICKKASANASSEDLMAKITAAKALSFALKLEPSANTKSDYKRAMENLDSIATFFSSVRTFLEGHTDLFEVEAGEEEGEAGASVSVEGADPSLAAAPFDLNAHTTAVIFFPKTNHHSFEIGCVKRIMGLAIGRFKRERTDVTTRANKLSLDFGQWLVKEQPTAFETAKEPYRVVFEAWTTDQTNETKAKDCASFAEEFYNFYMQQLPLFRPKPRKCFLM